jgi:SAM-dependent methyltransferase
MAEQSAGGPRPAPAADYDEFVDWDARLRREGPFFRELFESEGVRTVVDVGAGSARHAILFATWGLEVVAVDPDESMLAQAEHNMAPAAPQIGAAGGSLRLVEAAFGELESLGLSGVDAVTCTGNALPHVDGHAGLDAAIADFASVLRPGGLLVLHLLNHARLVEKRPRAIPPKVRDTADGTKVFLRVIDYPPGDEFLDFDFVTLVRAPDGDWTLSDRRSLHTVVTDSLLDRVLGERGFDDVRFFGGHDRHALDPSADESLIAVARRV